MNKKGFMFIETIVMCAILMVALLMIYKSYTSAITKEKEKLNYNFVAGEIRLNLIKKYLIDKNSEWICENELTCGKANTLLNDPFDPKEYVNLKEEVPASYYIYKIYNIQSLYLAKCDAVFRENDNSKKNNTDTSINADFYMFLYSMKPCSDNKKYRFIAEFLENDGKYYYAWVEYPYVGEGQNE